MKLDEIIDGQRIIEHDKHGIFVIKKNNIDLLAEAKDVHTITYTHYRKKGFLSQSQAKAQAREEFEEVAPKAFSIKEGERLIEKYTEYLKSLEVDIDSLATDTEIISHCLEKIYDLFTEEELVTLNWMDEKKRIEQHFFERTADYRAEEAQLKFILQQTVYTTDNKPYWETLEDLGKDTDEDKILWLLSEKKLLEQGAPSNYTINIPVDYMNEPNEDKKKF